MCLTVRSKKMAGWRHPSSKHDGWTYPARHGPHRAMTTRFFAPTRREVLAGLAATAAGAIPGSAAPSATTRLALEARPATLALIPARPATETWELAAATSEAVRLRRGDRCEVALRNKLPVALAPAWYGLDGASAAEPILANPPTASDRTETSIFSMSCAGT